MRVGLGLIVLGLVFAAPARATVIPVTTTADPLTMGDCSLREAVDAANLDTGVDTCPAGSGDDVIRLGTGTYLLATGGAADNSNGTGDLDAVAGNGALTIEGAGAARTAISAQGLGDRVLDILPGETVTLRGLTVTRGAPPGEDGGGIRNAGTLTLIDAAVVANRAADGAAGGPPGPGHAGGGIFSSGALTLLRSSVSDNVAGTGGRGDDQPGVNGWPGGAGGPGGGIFATGPLTLDHSLIAGNDAGAGGRGGDGSIGGAGGDGGDGGGLGTAGALTMTSTLVLGNTTGAGGDGGIADSGQGGDGGDGGDGGGVGAGAAASVAFSTLHANTVGGGGAGGLNVDLTFASPGTAGIGTAIAGQARLARTVAAGSCAGAFTDGGFGLGGAGCPGSHAAPALTAAGVPGLGSPAIDGAPVSGCPATDLPGTARPQGIGCDIGAFEVAAGTLAFSPTALTFRRTRVGGVRRLAVTVSNTGLPGLAVPAATVTGAPHFRLGAVTCTATLAGRGTCSVKVAFTPKRKGARTGTLRIGTRAIALSGRAVLRCVVPKLKGKTLRKARRALRKAHCTLGTVTRRDGGRPGRIRRSRPKAKAVRPVGTAVNVIVNR